MSLSIEEVVLAFEHWRFNVRRYIGDKIPDDLWVMVKKILPHYKKPYICKKLGISRAQLKHHFPDYFNEEPIKDSFVQASLPPGQSDYELVLKGDKKTLSIKIPEHQLEKLLPIVVGAL